MESRNRANRSIEISSDFQRHVNRFCFLIVASECSDREIDIERLHLRVQWRPCSRKRCHFTTWFTRAVSVGFGSSSVSVLENETAVRRGEAPEIDGAGVATPFNIRE